QRPPVSRAEGQRGHWPDAGASGDHRRGSFHGPEERRGSGEWERRGSEASRTGRRAWKWRGGFLPSVMAKVRLVVGCMTGTSLDALDVALVRVSGAGLGISASVLRTASAPLGALAGPLRALAEQQPLPA